MACVPTLRQVTNTATFTERHCGTGHTPRQTSVHSHNIRPHNQHPWPLKQEGVRLTIHHAHAVISNWAKQQCRNVVLGRNTPGVPSFKSPLQHPTPPSPPDSASPILPDSNTTLSLTHSAAVCHSRPRSPHPLHNHATLQRRRTPNYRTHHSAQFTWPSQRSGLIRSVNH
jgi:hypothetical protein